MQLTSCKLASLLRLAEQEHARYEHRFKFEGMGGIEKPWPDFYAGFIMAQLKTEELSLTFADVAGSQPHRKTLDELDPFDVL